MCTCTLNPFLRCGVSSLCTHCCRTSRRSFAQFNKLTPSWWLLHRHVSFNASDNILMTATGQDISFISSVTVYILGVIYSTMACIKSSVLDPAFVWHLRLTQVAKGTKTHQVIMIYTAVPELQLSHG